MRLRRGAVLILPPSEPAALTDSVIIVA